MDSASGSYMQYNNNLNDNDAGYGSLFPNIEQYANLDDTSSQGFDPALFTDEGLASFSHQPTQQTTQNAQTSFNQAQRQSQSQSPALPQFKASRTDTMSPVQYGQNIYNTSAMSHSYNPQLLSRPTPSPGPFDQYAYQPQHMNYGQPQFNYAYNSFQPQRQGSTPSQAFRPQVLQQTQQYLTGARPSPQPQAHLSQVQNTNGLSYTYQQSSSMSQQLPERNVLDNSGQSAQSSSTVRDATPSSGATAPQMHNAQNRPIQSSPYFTMSNTQQGMSTLDPRALSMQQQHLQRQQSQPNQASAPQPRVVQNGQPQSMFPSQVQASATSMYRPDQQAKVKRTAKHAGSVGSSDSDLEIEDEDPQPKPAAISIARPLDERGQILWDIINAVWSPHNKPVSADQIRTAITFAAQSLQTLRNKWKQANEQLKQAEIPNSTTRSHVPSLKASVENFRMIMEILAFRITSFAHPSILKRLGENSFVLSALYGFLLDRVNAEDYNSKLITNILQLVTKMITVDEEQLEKVKWTKILARFVKKSSNESKDYAQQILKNAKNATAKKKLEAAGQGPASPSSGTNGQVAGVKRPREGSDSSQQAKKAAVKPASKPLSVQIAEQRKLKEREKAIAARAGKAEKPTVVASAAAVPTRPKVPGALPQKSSPFATLLSASKKPGTSNAERAAKEKIDPALTNPAPADIKKDVIVKAEAPSVKPVATSTAPASSFLGFLADMEKPKDSPKTKTEDIPGETSEARAKRLRKESRRKLRVSWKPEGTLVETRIFEHDPDEDTGHEDSQMRDVGDTVKEGEMLKHRLQMDEMDDDSDDEFEYYMPTEVDFTDMHAVIKETSADTEIQNFIKCGGQIVPQSPASEAQTKHESGNMMTMWAAGEQPNTPKEPPEAEDDDFSPILDFGEPSAGQVQIRQREQQVLARRNTYQPQPQSQVQTSAPDLASMLSGLYQQQGWLQQQQNQASTQMQGLDLSQLLAQAAQSQQQQVPYQMPAAATNPTTTPSAFQTNLAALLGSLQPASQVNNPLPVGYGENPNPFPGDKSKDKNKKKVKSGAPIGSDGLPLNYKTKVCQFWLEGKCNKGDSCTYRHDHEGEA